MFISKEKRFIERLEELINEGIEVAKLEKESYIGGSYFHNQDVIDLQAWLVKVKNIIRNIFNKESEQYLLLKELTSNNIHNARRVYSIIGLLKGAKNDLENGFLIKQEFIIAGEIFDSVLEQAKYLNNKGYKDPAAVLTRVVIEDALKRIAKEEHINPEQKASVLNNKLKEKERYPKSQWRLLQAWLDIGNAAAHGKFNEYSHKNINELIDDINEFLSVQFS